MRVPGLEDSPDGGLSWVDVARVSHGILVCLAHVLDAHGETMPHIVVYDAWRRLLFIGAGELQKEWIVGLLGIQGDDLKGGALDRRMRELRVVKLLGARMLKVKAPPPLLLLPPPPPPPGGERLSGAQRKQLKRARELYARSGGS